LGGTALSVKRHDDRRRSLISSRSDVAELGSLLTDAGSCVSDPTSGQQRCIQRLHDLRRRLARERFQLAVVGQFKRGKSTLLNALLNGSILPMAVVPLTAIPTFIESGETPCVRAIFPSRAPEELKAERPEGLVGRLAELVTEEANPHNVLGLSRVEVALPVSLLERGVVLIDTPGVGSTFRHNTEKAEAILPECDAALFVVSPDPPITEVEVAYLAQVRANVAKLVVVLNKIDLVDADERATAIAFLRRTLAEKAMFDESLPIFPLSARTALRAKQSGDDAQLAASGLPALERYLGEFLVRDKRAALTSAIARKAALVGAELLTETEMRLQALRLPTEELDAAIATFDAAMAHMDEQRRVVHDLLEGDRRRMLEQIETDAEELRSRAALELWGKLDRPASGDGESGAANKAERVTAYFESELGRAFTSFRQHLKDAVDTHRRRINDLVEEVRETAAAVLRVSFRAGDAVDEFEFRREPYWVTSGRIETLTAITFGSMERLLPATIRRRRVRRRLLREIETIVQRNVENLRWATRQNVEDAFRNLAGALDEALAARIEATRSVIRTALERRHQQTHRVFAETEHIEATVRKLSALLSSLRRIASSGGLTPGE
jgi:small GTP-binding protein